MILSHDAFEIRNVFSFSGKFKYQARSCISLLFQFLGLGRFCRSQTQKIASKKTTLYEVLFTLLCNLATT